MDSGGSSVRGIVLAGRFPWSDSPLDRLLPRQLLPVAHQPLMSYALRWLRRGGIQEVVVCLNRASRSARNTIMECGADVPGLAFHEDELPRGPAGCARDAALEGEGQTFFVADGTAIPTATLSELLQTHRSSGALATVVVQRAARSESAAGRPACPVGLYVLERRALEMVPERGFQDLKENLIPRLHRAGERIAVHEVPFGGPRVLNTASYRDANRWALTNLAAMPTAPDGYSRAGELLVHHSAHIDPSARVLGPVLIGPDSKLLPRATVIGPTVLGTGCTVGVDAVLSRTVAWNRCLVSANAVVDACVMADDAIAEDGAPAFGQVVVPSRRGAELSGMLGRRVEGMASLPLRPRPEAR